MEARGRKGRWRNRPTFERRQCGCRLGISPGYFNQHRVRLEPCECCRDKEWLQQIMVEDHKKMWLCADCMRDRGIEGARA